MKLSKILGNTYYIKGGTNSGVFLFDNNECLLIDPGLSGVRPKSIINMFEKEGLDLKYIINTHEHEDHYGGCYQLKEEKNDIQILSSEKAKLYIENPEIFSNYILGGKSNKFLLSELCHRKVEKVDINRTIYEGKLSINHRTLEIVDLKGHTDGSIGVLTEDKVFFIGDLLIGEKILEKYDFLFLQDVKEYLCSLEKIQKIDFDYIVLGHDKNILNKEQSINLINKHKDAVYKYLKQIKDLLKDEMNTEDLLRNIIEKNNLTYNYKEYYFYRSSLVSFISYLAELEEIDYKLINSGLLYYTKIK